MGKLLGMGDGGVDTIMFDFGSNPSQCSGSQKKTERQKSCLRGSVILDRLISVYRTILFACYQWSAPWLLLLTNQSTKERREVERSER